MSHTTKSLLFMSHTTQPNTVFMSHTTQPNIYVPYNQIKHLCHIQPNTVIYVPYNQIKHLCTIRLNQTLLFMSHTTESNTPLHVSYIQMKRLSVSHTPKVMTGIPVLYSQIKHCYPSPFCQKQTLISVPDYQSKPLLSMAQITKANSVIHGPDYQSNLCHPWPRLPYQTLSSLAQITKANSVTPDPDYQSKLCHPWPRLPKQTLFPLTQITKATAKAYQSTSLIGFWVSCLLSFLSCSFF